jgi:hypothetical protein
MASKYRVCGHTTVTVVVEVVAESEAKAYEKASDELCNLDAYVGNGGTDKLIGVYGDGQSVSADEEIVYDDIERLGRAEDEEDGEDNEDDGE